MLFIQYPKCTTCQKAKKFLDENKIKYTDRNIVTDNPTKEDLENFIKIGNLDIKKLFNTSGMKYRELGLKDKLKTMSDDEKLELLATDGMLVKRPLLVGDDFVLTGFKQELWADKLKL
ncbi:transcriptional regulator, Spx/MgsR family [Peptoanaerobacter stomatis]|uniref:Transcriptional regulator, Spx/MgsR family n=1 Tax=Peptoanaerobacter stomatis TaxID=796937 RepID=J6HN94_9FIRM|nr:arsenate reductase family protein [Peptoanaerobacter stomatis]EJU23843.1 transcriptional regulator, Spx/MgsR family [Peptoanaerobacter stomatis]NWO24120.1 arsenate reductase family protein [Peptostreptococcaceae bacterium oral taxon 081]